MSKITEDQPGLCARPPDDLAIGPEGLVLWKGRAHGSEVEVRAAEACLSDDERGRAGRFRHARDRTRYVLARAGLRRILGAYLQTDPRGIRLAYSASGKPYLSGAHAASGLQFNLSHSGEWVAYAFTRGGAVGIDIERIERIEPMPDLLDLAARHFAPSELAALQSLEGAQQLEAFYACWTRKEAYLKGRGDGLSYPLNELEVSLLPSEPARLIANRREPADVQRWSLHSVDVATGYAGAVAVGA